jgi:hypothetical protein
MSKDVCIEHQFLKMDMYKVAFSKGYQSYPNRPNVNKIRTPDKCFNFYEETLTIPPNIKVIKKVNMYLGWPYNENTFWYAA